MTVKQEQSMNTEIVAQADSAVHLVRYEAARQALKEAHSFDEVKAIRDKTQALAMYARQARDTEMARWVSDIKIRAERKCGEMLKATAQSGERETTGKGGRDKRQILTRCKDLSKPTIADFGIGYIESSRYQKLAAIPEEVFESALEESAKKKGVPTTAGVMRISQELDKVLREGAAMAADMKEHSRKCQARNAKDPLFQGVKTWTPLLAAIDGCVTAINRMLQADTMWPCPQEKLDELDRNWTTISAFIAQYGCPK